MPDALLGSIWRTSSSLTSRWSRVLRSLLVFVFLGQLKHPRPGGPLARVQRAAERRVLLEHGQVLRDALRREAITIEELRSAALERGFQRLDDIELIVLEPNGHLAIMGHEAARHWRQRRAGGRRSDH